MPRGGRREKAGRKSGWVNSETQLIRVPKCFVNRLLEIARHLDHGGDAQLTTIEFSGNVSEDLHHSDLTQQLNIFGIGQPLPLSHTALAKRLNVSSSTLSRHKKYGNEKLLTWTFEADKEWGWYFVESTGKYCPMAPSEFDEFLCNGF